MAKDPFFSKKHKRYVCEIHSATTLDNN